MISRRHPRLSLLAIAFLALTQMAAHGEDWPQILGPDRNGGVAADGVAEWRTPPRRRWTHPVGQGYAGPAVASGRVIVFHRVQDLERLEALDIDTGRTIWTVDFPAYYRGGFNPDDGPRCVPLIHDGTIVVFGAAGHAHAVAAADGGKLWSRDLYGDYNAPEGYFGAGSSPIAVGDRVLLNVGGGDGAGLVALNLANGKTIWTSTNEDASYSSPIMIRRSGAPQVIFVARFNVLGINPKDGRVRFRVPFGQRGPTVNAASPVAFQNHIFVTASYGVGAMLLEWDGSRAKQVWANDRALSSQYNTPLFYQGHLYGIHGREDVGQAHLRCIDAESGRVVWSRDNFGVANLNRMGDKLLAMTSEGMLVVLKATPEKYQELSRAKIAEGSTRALPAFGSGRMFCRNNQGKAGELICWDLTKD